MFTKNGNLPKGVINGATTTIKPIIVIFKTMLQP
jgi:hypothetical protein